METKLYQSPVVFNEENHTYTLGDVMLSGITPIIHKYLFPHTYDNVSEAVLEKARQRGTAIHSDVEFYFSLNTKSGRKSYLNDFAKIETKNLCDWSKKNNVNFIANEYLVSDEKYVASKVDLVDSNYNLYDIKSYANMTTDNKESARWQLSIYKYLFEFNNPDKKCEHLYIIQLHDDVCKIVEVSAIPANTISALLNAFALDLDTFNNPLQRITEESEEELLDSLRHAKENADKYSNDVEVLKCRISKYMMENGGRKITKSGGWSFSLGDDSVSKKFDEKAFKEDHPKMWEKYCKEYVVKGRFTITYPKEDERQNATENP